MAGDELGERVKLHVYDISNGLARQLSPMLLGSEIPALYHTSIVVGNEEAFFGGGVQRSIAGQTPFGTPIQVIDLGVTHLPRDLREAMLADVSRQFTAESYNLITRNCNHFASAWAELLTGSPIPDEYVQQAARILSSPVGQLLLPMLQGMEQRYGSVTSEGFR